MDKNYFFPSFSFLIAARNDFQKMMDFFDRLREDDIEPSLNTIQYVSNILKKNNQPIPPILLSAKPSESVVPSKSTEATKAFLNYLQTGDVESALNEANELKKGFIRTLSFQSLTDLLNLCLENNCANSKFTCLIIFFISVVFTNN